MPRQKQPSSLQLLALDAVGELVKTVGRNLVQNFSNLTHTIENADSLPGFKETVKGLNIAVYSNIPWCLYDKMVPIVLSAVSSLTNEIKDHLNHIGPISFFMRKMAEIVIHPHLKEICISKWPSTMTHILYINLPNLTGLEHLDLDLRTRGWMPSIIEHFIIAGLRSMPHLKSLRFCYDCTDSILSAVGKSCLQLRSLVVMFSRYVTDESVPFLLCCKELRELKLSGTLVSVKGYANLLMGLHHLQELGTGIYFGYVLDSIRVNTGHAVHFNITQIEIRPASVSQLYLLCKMCPHVKQVSIELKKRLISVTVLSSLNELQELTLKSFNISVKYVKNLFIKKGVELTFLRLEHVDIDLNLLKHIGQFCPNLTTLEFTECKFVPDSSASIQVEVPLFEQLKSLTFLVKCEHFYFDLLLSHCINIKYIELGWTTTIDDEAMERIMAQNSFGALEEFIILRNKKLSMATVRLFITHCHNLRRLADLYFWNGISQQELTDFRNEIKRCNLALDICWMP